VTHGFKKRLRVVLYAFIDNLTEPPSFDPVVRTLSEKVFEPLQVFPEWLFWGLPELIDFVPQFGSFIGWEKFLQEDRNELYPSGDRVCCKTVKLFLGLVLQGKRYESELDRILT